MQCLNSFRRRLTVLVGTTVFSLGSLQGGEWPQYRGPSNDGHSPEKIAKTWPEDGPRKVWKAPTPGGFSSFVVGGGRAYTLVMRNWEGAEMETLLALDANSGKELWARPLGAIKLGDGGQSGARGNDGGDGPRSTPAIAGNRVYTYSARLVLTCFDAESGREVWSHDLVKEFAGRNIGWMNAQSPVLDGGLVFVAGGGEGQALLAFNQKDGEVKWKAFDDTMTHATAVPTTIHGQRQVVFFLKSGLLSVEPQSGKELWRYAFPWKTSSAASPVVAGDIVYCSAGYSVGGGAAKVTRDGNKWTATEIYRKPGDRQIANHWSTPVYKDGYLYGMFQFKEYGNGPVKCVDVKTGEVKWEKPGFGPGNVILAGNHVLALADDGRLVLFEATPTEYKELASSDVLDGKCWSSPVISNGRIFARSTKEAVCLEVPVASASR